MANGLLAQENDNVDGEDYWSQLRGNLLPSSAQLVKDFVQPFVHPIETFEGLKSLVVDPEAREAVGMYLKDRYGGLDNIKDSLRDDPIGVLSDIAGVASLGTGLAMKVPGHVGKWAKTANVASRLADPTEWGITAVRGGNPSNLPLVGSVLPDRNLGVIPAVRTGAEGGFALTAGTGIANTQRAVREGLEGGADAERFRTGMRGNSNLAELYDQLRNRLDQVGDARRESYKTTKGTLADAQVDFDKLLKMVENRRTNVTSSGRRVGAINSRLDQIEKLIKKYRTKTDTTVYDVDIMKHEINDMLPRKMNEIDPSQSQTVGIIADIREELERIDPKYGEMMKDYSDAKIHERELRQAFSMNNNNSQQQAIRRLMQATRENVHTDMGSLGKMLEDLDAGIMAEVTGRSFNTFLPTGSRRGINPALTAGALSMTGGGIPLAVASAVASSPRVVGEVLHGGARAYGAVAPTANALTRFGQTMTRLNPQPAFEGGRYTLPVPGDALPSQETDMSDMFAPTDDDALQEYIRKARQGG